MVPEPLSGPRRRLRAWRAGVACLLFGLLLSSCSAGGGTEPRGSERVGSALNAPKTAGCGPLDYSEVAGQRPGYGARTLRRFAAEDAVCSGIWNPRADEHFTPQSLAIAGRVAYVGGYRWRPSVGTQNCQLLALDLDSGRTIGFVPRFEAAIYRPTPTYCRHGGGMQIDEHGVWVMETQRMWLLDPAAIRAGRDPVLRWWRLGEGLRGSAMVLHDGKVGVAGYRASGNARLTWYDADEVLRPGVTDLVLGERPLRTSEVTQLSRERIGSNIQGATSRRGVWLSGSGSGCAFLQAPNGTRIAAPPGTEGIQFVRGELWLISESGARHFAKSDSKLVPMLMRLDLDRLRTIRIDDSAACLSR